MNRIKHSCRSLNRRLDRRLNRTAPRRLTRGRCPCDYFAIALNAYTRALRAWRRLMKLAPRIYDIGVVDHEERQRLDRLEQRKKWEPALRKAYGIPDSTPLEVNEYKPPIMPANPRTRRVIEREEAQRSAWTQIAHDAMADYKKYTPHTVPSLTQIARLGEIGITYGRLASGMETRQRKPEPPLPGYLSFEESLEKIYGNRDSSPGCGRENNMHK